MLSCSASQHQRWRSEGGDGNLGHIQSHGEADHRRVSGVVWRKESQTAPSAIVIQTLG